jgi:hypothetical protein
MDEEATEGDCTVSAIMPAYNEPGQIVATVCVPLQCHLDGVDL